MNRPTTSLVTATLLSLLSATLPVRAAQPAPLDVKRLTPAVMVKVLRITGIGPDGQRHTLLNAPKGIAVAVNDFSPLAPRVAAPVPAAPPRAYHDLQAELAPGVFVMGVSGSPVQVVGAADSPALIALSGAVLDANGKRRPLGLKPVLAQPPKPQRCRSDHLRDDD